MIRDKVVWCANLPTDWMEGEGGVSNWEDGLEREGLTESGSEGHARGEALEDVVARRAICASYSS